MRLFSTNPVLFKIKYINRDRIDTTIGVTMVIGQAFHQAMQVYYGGSDTLIPVNETEAIEYGLKSGLDFIEKYNDGFIKFSDRVPNKQKAFDIFTFAFNSYIKENKYNNGETVSTEEEITEKIDVEWKGKKLSLPIKLKGFIDRIIEQDKKLKIIDYKTCASFSDPDKIDGAKILQAVIYYLLVLAKYKIAPYSAVFEEVKTTANKDGGPQVRKYEIVYEDNDLFFDFFFRFYEDMTRALNGEMVYVPNVDSMFDNEVAVISYIHRLDVEESKAKLFIKNEVNNITDLLKKEIQNAGNMRKLMKSMEDNLVQAKNINYDKMKTEEKIQVKLMEHGMVLTFDSVIEGSTIDLYKYVGSIGLKMSRLKSYVQDIEQVLGISGIRILAPIPNSSLIGFEVPKMERLFPKLPNPSGTFKLFIGKAINGEDFIFDIREAPHMFVAGSSGSGKSVFLNSLIQQLLKIDNVQLFLFDPKQVELSQYEESVEDYKHSHAGITSSLQSLVEEMEKRYTIMKKAKVKNISEIGSMQYKFVIIDEYADLTLKGGVEGNIQLLAQKGRACGIHLIIATQRASTKIISGDIKTNFVTKAVFRMAKETDSRVMLDESGAEKLLGKGDFLFSTGGITTRLQGYAV